MAKDIGTETLTVVRGGKVDKLSDETPATTQHDITGCALTPRGSHEEGRGWVIVDGWSVYAPYDADINADDIVLYDGYRWSVDGQPGRYKTKRGKPKATIFYLNRVGRATP